MELQSVSSLPLQIDTVDVEAMEGALRIYNGKAMVNSVSGKQESMDKVFPLIQKYGGVVIGLALDEERNPGRCRWKSAGCKEDHCRSGKVWDRQRKISSLTHWQ